jgi:hypothetical protein
MFSWSFDAAQKEVLRWCKATFGEKDPRWTDVDERCLRHYEEDTELMQALGMTEEQCIAMVKYVFSRPIGEPKQEMGGTLITLAALANSTHISMRDAFEEENRRCWEIKDKIAAKQMVKPLRGKNQPNGNNQ